ncbi:hypothetical protein ANAPC3_00333 [Anaplasma phagocytophilum]|nr:hypothetical protein ANAPC2_00202 [Anaplasma phagocytophilum]SBO30867.1 hypothetical protein ANAPC3_00333 [Anaplasma phagocytophilum]SBO33585.1 hypothetical protein ANAPC4_01215 [Anaplasma phagocytophilum]
MPLHAFYGRIVRGHCEVTCCVHIGMLLCSIIDTVTLNQILHVFHVRTVRAHCEVTCCICIGMLLRRIIGGATQNQNTIAAGE